MLRGKLIVLLLYQPWQWSTDYQNQTVKTLEKLDNKVVIYYGHKETVLWKKEGIKSLFFKKNKNLNFFIPIHFLPLRRLAFVRKINQFINLHRFNHYCKNLFRENEKKTTPSQAIFWFFEPNSLIQSLHLLDIKHKHLIFDCVDYFPIKELKFALKKSTDIFCISQTMQKLLNQLTKSKKTINLIPQGFDLNSFKKYKSVSNIDFSKDKTYKIGFVGGIDNRLNYPLIIDLVKNNPQWQFLFYGPWQKLNKQNRNLLNNLRDFPNTSWGKASKKEVPKVILNFDVGIIPYEIKQKKNYYSYPMKMFEYFYLGKPVVSTPIVELQDKRFSKFVKIAKDSRKFEQSIKTLLSQAWPISFQKEQRRMAIVNSWEKKLNSISNQLKIVYKTKNEN
jgi:glycosyltransferase involved in cell wall biosynthesis